MVSKIKLLIRYCLNFGLARGLYIFLTTDLLSANKIYLPKPGFPVQYRPGTHDINVFREVFLFKIYEISFNEPIRTIIDAGAHIGLASIYFIGKCMEATIFAIEPDKMNFELLLINTEKCPRIKQLHGAIWNRDTSLHIKNLHENTWAYEVEECPDAAPDRIKGYSLNSIMKINNLDRIDLLKMDVEGAEKEIFSENYEYWLSHTANIIIELHDWRKNDCSKNVFSAISKFHFSASVINNMIWFKNLESF